MPDILAPRNRAILTSFAEGNVLLAFDYDGTLAPIASTPARARLPATTRRLLTSIAHCYPCVVISGRRLDDVAKRLEGIPIWYAFGNFGHEPAPHGHRPPTRVGDWARRLTERLPTHRGLVVEEKAYSVTIHYRHVRDKIRALAAIEHAVSEIPDARAIAGSEAMTLLPRGGPDKGVALQVRPSPVPLQQGAVCRRRRHGRRCLCIGPGRSVTGHSRGHEAAVGGALPVDSTSGHEPVPADAAGPQNHRGRQPHAALRVNRPHRAGAPEHESERLAGSSGREVRHDSAPLLRHADIQIRANLIDDSLVRRQGELASSAPPTG